MVYIGAMGVKNLINRRVLLRAPASSEYEPVAEWLNLNAFGDVGLAKSRGRYTARTLQRATETGDINCLVIDANNIGPIGVVTWRTAR
ncbi:hypothetical protein, partial [Escherichia coli]|uniref:hypothetical protein n=1 Tax=Escherichia coli TaxID=562 RepID=UPI0032E49C3B